MFGHYTFSYVKFVRIQIISYSCVAYVRTLHILDVAYVRTQDIIFSCVTCVRTLHIFVCNINLDIRHHIVVCNVSSGIIHLIFVCNICSDITNFHMYH